MIFRSINYKKADLSRKVCCKNFRSYLATSLRIANLNNYASFEMNFNQLILYQVATHFGVFDYRHMIQNQC